MIDRVARAYNEHAADSPELLTAIRHAEGCPSFARWPGEFLDRPLFLGRRELRDFTDDLQHLVALLVSLPERLFDGDLDRFCAALGIDERLAMLMRRLGGGTAPSCGRADVYHDGTSMKLLEFGIGSELGGWARGGEIPRALLEVAAFAAFAERYGLEYTHTSHNLAKLLRQLGAKVAPGRDPVVAIIEGPGALTTGGHGWRVLQDVMRGLGFDFHLGEVGDIRDREGKLYIDGVPVDIVYRAFEAAQLYDPEAAVLAEPIFRAHEAGSAVLWTPLESNLFGEKGCMALLSDPVHREHFSTAERSLIDRMLPWTRSLTDDSFLDNPDLMAYCRERRAELIVKPNRLYGGIGVVPGWEQSDRDWLRILREKAAEGCIVQERVTPRAEQVINPDSGAIEPWHAVYGFFYTPNGYAGAYARALPKPDSAVIGVGGKVRTAGVFHHDG